MTMDIFYSAGDLAHNIPDLQCCTETPNQPTVASLPKALIEYSFILMRRLYVETGGFWDDSGRYIKKRPNVKFRQRDDGVSSA